jgi:predicted Rossmann fold nucleotide-binding protein DprA/Smf involved in DNA uptake
MSLEKERRHFVSLGNVLTMLGMTGALATGWVTLAADSAQQKERVDNLREQAKEIKADVKETKRDVQTILRKLVEMETARKLDDRAARERDRAR